MSVACPRCGPRPYSAHITLEAQSRARWRGKSFDADQAMGNIGLAIADVLGYSAREFDRFHQAVQVQAFREDLPENPPERFDPKEGERWEFHVGFRENPGEDKVARARDAARKALDASRNYENARVLPEQTEP